MLVKRLVAVALVLCGTASVAQAEPAHICYINDGYAVGASPDPDNANTIFAVLRKTTPEQLVDCPLDPEAADLVLGAGDFGNFYADLLANHLVLEVSTGPQGDVVVVDLRDGKTVLDISGTYDYAGEDGIHYWERGAEGTPETCDRYDELTGYGLSTGLLHEKVLNLDSGETSETGLIQCEGIS